MIDVVPVPLVWIRTAAFALALAIVGVFFLGRSCATDPARLPARTEARLVEHRVRTVQDTAAIHQQQHVEQAARAAMDGVTVRAHRADSVATLYRAIADSLATDFVHADDSAATYRSAYQARTVEADSLRSAGVQKDSIITITMHGWRAADSAFAIQAGQLARSDTIIAELLPLAQHPDRCRILYLVPCPTRSQAAIVGVVAGAATIAILRARVTR